MGVIEKILKKKATDSESMYLKAEEFCRQGYYLDAIDILDKLMTKDPLNAHTSRLKGYALYQIGSFEEALQYFDQALGIDPNLPDALVYIGLIYSGFGKHTQALVLYDRALVIHPNLIQAWYAKGLTLAILQKYDDALLAYEKVLYLDPRHVDALIGISVARKKVGNVRLDKSPISGKDNIQHKSGGGPLTNSPTTPVMVREVPLPYQQEIIKPVAKVSGSALTMQTPTTKEPISPAPKPSTPSKQVIPQSAVKISGSPRLDEELDRIKVSPKNTSTISLPHMNPVIPASSSLKFAEQEPIEAPLSHSPRCSSYNETIREMEQNPDEEMDPDQLCLLGDLYMKTGRYKDATELFERILEIEYENAHAWQFLGDARKKSGVYDEALFAYEKSLEIDPENALVWINRAKVLVMMERHDEAITSCDKAIALDDVSLEAWLYKGFILKKTRRSSDAIAAYNRVLELNPRHDQAARQLKNIKGGA